MTLGGRPRARLRVVILAAGLAAGASRAGAGDFGAWLADLRREAETRGVSAGTLDRALAGVVPLPRVLELDRRQPETILSLAAYVQRVVTTARVAEGRRLLTRHRARLAEVEARYRVAPAVVVALWGIESDFGRLPGDFPTIPALATLAWEGRRGALFREELLAALRMVDEGHATLAQLAGSWAGALGQPQFVPTSFLRFAVDGDGDGRRDIWDSPADVFASIGNYLLQAGWRPDESWGGPVRVPRGFDPAAGGPDVPRPVVEWRRLGVEWGHGPRLPAAAPAALVRPGRPPGPVFLVGENFQVLLRWNRSPLFAVAAGTLADRLEAGRGPAPGVVPAGLPPDPGP